METTITVTIRDTADLVEISEGVEKFVTALCRAKADPGLVGMALMGFCLPLLLEDIGAAIRDPRAPRGFLIKTAALPPNVVQIWAANLISCGFDHRQVAAEFEAVAREYGGPDMEPIVANDRRVHTFIPEETDA